METKYISHKGICSILEVRRCLIGSSQITNGIILAQQQDKTAAIKMLTVICLVGERVTTTTGLLPINPGARAKTTATITPMAKAPTIYTTKLV